MDYGLHMPPLGAAGSSAAGAGRGPSTAAAQAAPCPDDDITQRGIEEVKRKLCGSACDGWFAACYEASQGKPQALCKLAKRPAWSCGPIAISKLLSQLLQDTKAPLFGPDDSRAVAVDIILRSMPDLVHASKDAATVTDLHPSLLTALQTCATIMAAKYDALYDMGQHSRRGAAAGDAVMRDAVPRRFKAAAPSQPASVFDPQRAPATKRLRHQRRNAAAIQTETPPSPQAEDAVMRTPRRSFKSRAAVPPPAPDYPSHRDAAKRPRSRSPSDNRGKRSCARPAVN